ncbi:hypothetical protein [Caulobacter sp. DWR2-3-1b2]
MRDSAISITRRALAALFAPPVAAIGAGAAVAADRGAPPPAWMRD